MNLAAHSTFDSLAPAVLNAIPHPVVVVGADGRIAGANQAAESFFQSSCWPGMSSGISSPSAAHCSA
jgi:nitrogen-specific signal transduction histidine kinase